MYVLILLTFDFHDYTLLKTLLFTGSTDCFSIEVHATLVFWSFLLQPTVLPYRPMPRPQPNWPSTKRD